MKLPVLVDTGKGTWLAIAEAALYDFPPFIPTVKEGADNEQGKAAIMRGPMVYCLEGADNEAPPERIAVSADTSMKARYRPELPGGVVTLSGTAAVQGRDGVHPAEITAIPYYAWANREPSAVRVWLHFFRQHTFRKGEPDT